MKVILKRNFFAGGRRFKAEASGTTLPDELADHLPGDAEVIEPPAMPAEELEKELDETVDVLKKEPEDKKDAKKSGTKTLPGLDI